MKNLLILLVALPTLVYSQQTAILSTSSIQAEISSDGFVSAFNVPNAHTGSMSSILSRLSFWIVGQDQGQFLHVADSDAGHFQMGFRGIPNSNKIWKITKAEIESHLLDFQQDGQIDDTIPAIFSWPALGNEFSPALNGFSMDSVHYENMASYKDDNYDDMYNPQMGEYPLHGTSLVDYRLFPTEIIFMPMYTNSADTSDRVPNFDIALTAFVFDCPNQEGLNKSVYFYLKMKTAETFDFENLSFSILADGNIGNPMDDYVGSIEDGNSAYFYNSDENADAIFGASPPALLIHQKYGQIDELGIQTGLHGIITPFKPNLSSLIDPNTTLPTESHEYQNYSDAKWRDGTPITSNGNGYQQDPSNVETNYIFSGNTAKPNEWTELSAQNQLHDRTVLLIGAPLRVKAQSKNRILFSVSYVDDVRHTTMRQRISEVSENYERILFNDSQVPLPSYDTLCYGFVSTEEKIDTKKISVYPNPSKTYVQVELAPKNIIKNITIYNTQGIKIRALECGRTKTSLDLDGLPVGLYSIVITDIEGGIYHRRIVKQ